MGPAGWRSAARKTVENACGPILTQPQERRPNSQRLGCATTNSQSVRSTAARPGALQSSTQRAHRQRIATNRAWAALLGLVGSLTPLSAASPILRSLPEKPTMHLREE